MKNMFTTNSLALLKKAVIVVLLTQIFLTGIQAQSKITVDKARQMVETKRTEFDLTINDLNDFVITDQYTDKHNNVTHVYLQQRYKGIEIEGAVMSLHFKNETEILHVADGFEKRISGRIRTGRSHLSAIDAVAKASATLGLKNNKPLELLRQASTESRESVIRKNSISQRDIPAKLVYQPSRNGNLDLVWKVEIYTTDGQHYWQMKVDATDGKILEKHDLVLHCDFGHPAAGPGVCMEGHSALEMPGVRKSAVQLDFNSAKTEQANMAVANAYRIFDAPVETPNHGGRTLIYTNGDPVASPFGWHNDGLLSYTITKGNNVYAYEDQLGANAGLPTSGGLTALQPLNFDFPLDLNQSPDTYKDAAVTNLFYWNNLVHDVFYHYGFTEAAGNFQTNNLSKGGLGNDAVMAEAQDGGGTNNANFLTLPDGIPGRMQMYLWSSNEVTELVHIDASESYPSGGPSFTAIPAAFGPALDQTGVAGELVIIETNVNGSSTCNSCGCGTGQGVGLPPNNDVLGKIVLIDRGDCSFIEKIMGAQLGGAAGAIVVNNNPGEGPIAMGGDETGAAILIPSVMV
ncbi:MAG: M36 family metallopeptidase, partial [Lewinella sp.]|nr:M36 family metallopeptidase [Lewinella sp.]